jgi:AcrR family transcriptional regulator
MQRRHELAQKVFQTILEDGNTSLRAMAERTAVSRPTLRHYFGSREGAVKAALASAADLGRPLQERLATLPVGHAKSTLTEAMNLLVVGWRDLGVGRLHEVGLKTGLEDAGTARTYVSDILEPLLQAVETLLVRLVSADRLAVHNTRQGALMLASPLVMALLHQDGLGGGGIRPLGMDAMVDTLVDAYCRAHTRQSGGQERRKMVGTIGG